MALNILIVDDSGVMRKLIKKSLRIIGRDVNDLLEATDGNDALGVLSREHVDLILLDINMPKLDGIEFLNFLRSNREWKTIPVVAITAETSDKRINELQQIGIQGCLPKPFQPEDLRDVLSQIFAHELSPQGEGT